MIKKLFKKIFFHLYPSTKVIITPKGARWGNLLYFFLRAYLFEKQGKSLRVLYTNHMNDLLRFFPELNKYVIYEKEVKFFHEKDSTNTFYQIFNKDFTEQNINDFIKEHLLSSNFVQCFFRNHPKPKKEDITINIRRGDFFEKGNSSIYGYDQVAFIKHIFKNHLPKKKWNQVNILSDDINWCKENFDFIKEYTSELNFPELNEDKIILSFLWVANSKNLILSNSTFSFWAAYISNYLYHSQENTYCPIFGSRRIENTALYQFNPKWNMIGDFNFNVT